jgi:four helix bundle protein
MARDSEVYFDFERLDVYGRSIEFADSIFNICNDFESSYRSSIVDQLRRAVLSISTNIAEGCGKRSRRERIKYFSYALDSAKECIPCLTLAHRQGQLSDEQNSRIREECTVICRMLCKLIHFIENQELGKTTTSRESNKRFNTGML